MGAGLLTTENTFFHRKELDYAEPVSLEALRRTIAWERANPPEQIPAGKFDYAAEDAVLNTSA